MSVYGIREDPAWCARSGDLNRDAAYATAEFHPSWWYMFRLTKRNQHRARS